MPDASPNPQQQQRDLAAALQARGWQVAVIIPCYNAAATVVRVIAGLPAWVRWIVVVDDASADQTAAALAACTDARLLVKRHPKNQGVGGAMRTGYGHALQLGADLAVKIDADQQMDPDDLPVLLAPLLRGEADYTKGNRFVSADALRQMPRVRLLGNAGLTFLTKLSSGAWNVVDPCNGYTAIHKTALQQLDLQQAHPRYFFESSLLMLLTVQGAVVRDVPMPARYGQQGSHLSVAQTLVQFPFLHVAYGIRRFVQQYIWRDFTATSVLVLLGVPVFGWGLLDAVAIWLRSRQTGLLTPTGTLIIPTLLLIVGFQLLLHALLLDIAATPKLPLQVRLRHGFAPLGGEQLMRADREPDRPL